MKLFTSVGLFVLLLSLSFRSNAATTYTLTAGNWATVVGSTVFVNGDIIVIPAGVSVNAKNSVTISANVTFNIYGTLQVTQNGTTFSTAYGTVFNLYSSAGTVTVSAQSNDVTVGGTTVFASGTSTVASSGNITRPSLGFGTPLPLKFTSFEASLKSGNAVQLSWTAVNDGPVTEFIIEHSTDGISFADVATVAATGGEHEQVSYTYELNNAKKGTNIYRIRHTSIDGNEVVYSSAKQISVAGAATTASAVVSAQAGKINIAISNTAANSTHNVMVSTLDGKVISRTQYSSDNTSITIPVNASGLIIVTVTDGVSYKTSQKIVM